MSPRARSQSSRLPARQSAARDRATFSQEMCAVEPSFGYAEGRAPTQRLEGLGYGTESSSDLDLAITRSRYFTHRHDYIREVLKMRRDLCNFGFRLVPAPGASEKDKLALKDFLEKEREARRAIEGYVRDSWKEWFTTENLITLWRADSRQPQILNPEDIKFTDHFGEEVLTITHNLSPAKIDAMTISAAAKARLKASRQIKITHADEVWSFEVVKDAKLGTGLGWPPLTPVLLALGQYESMEVGDNILGSACRKVIEMHSIGHETRYGIGAGGKSNFITKARADATKLQYRGKVGLVETAVNWDHKITWPRPDPKDFDGKKYEAVLQRLLWWGAPLGHMISARAFNPYLMDLLRTRVLSDRETLRLTLEGVVNEVWGEGSTRPVKLPCAVRIKWDERVLRDSRLLKELIQNGLNAGPISPTTYQEAAGVDPDEENERKERDADRPKKITNPIYDAAHGPPKPASAGGKPSGSKDKK